MNHVEVSLEFYFKGECHKPSAIVPLDQCMRDEDPMSQMYRILAAENGIGSYSHEFDIMIMEPLHFSNPTGLASNFVHNGEFDLEGFRAVWLEDRILQILQPIASTYLGIKDLDSQPDIKAALMAAYQAG